MTPEERFQENYRLVFWYLHKYRQDKCRDEDYQQQASLGLWKACLSYDESRGIKFSTYAVQFIHSGIRNLERKNYRCTRVESYSLDDNVCVSNDECTRLDLVENKEPSPENVVIFRDAIDSAFSKVNDGTKYVICRLMHGDNQSDIAKDLGVSRQRVSQRIKRFKDEYQKYMSL